MSLSLDLKTEKPTDLERDNNYLVDQKLGQNTELETGTGSSQNSEFMIELLSLGLRLSKYEVCSKIRASHMPSSPEYQAIISGKINI